MKTACLLHDDPRVIRIISDFIQRIDSSRCPKPEELICTALKGGRSLAALYRFNVHEHTYVLRVFAPQAKQLTRLHQILLAKQAGKIDVGPKVLFVDPQLEGIIMEFIPGNTVTPACFQDIDKLVHFAHFLQRLHQSSERFPIACSPFRRFHKFLSGANLPRELVEAKPFMEHLESILQPLPNVPTHLDLNSLNIMLSNERFFLVDWVNGGMSDAYFDLATFAIFHNLNESQSHLFLKHYFGRNPTKLEWNRFVVTQPVRLFVIAAALLSRPLEATAEQEILPPLVDFLRENAATKTNKSYRQIGSIMLNAAVNLLEEQSFKTALKELQK